MHKELSNPQGRYHILVCDINYTKYTIVNVYAPNVHQECFFYRVLRKVSQIQQGYLLLWGDVNLPSDPKIDSTTLSNRYQNSLQPLLFRYDLYDAWRCLNASERYYSFFSTSHSVYARLDLFLTDKWLLMKMKASKIINITWLDHASVTLLVDDTSTVNPTFIWRSNLRSIQADPTRSELTKALVEFF